MVNSADTKLRILSYNLLRHKAYPELVGLAEEYKPDIICLQESAVAELKPVIGKLSLAAKTKNIKYGLAIYYRRDKFRLVKTDGYKIRLAAYEKLIFPDRERLLVAHFQDLKTKKLVSVGCFHATHVVAPNSLRRQQILAATTTLKELAGISPAILIGDYNYPFFIKGLHKFMLGQGFQLSVSNEPTWQGRAGSYFTDFAAGIQTKRLHTATLPLAGSDHLPILVEVRY